MRDTQLHEARVLFLQFLHRRLKVGQPADTPVFILAADVADLHLAGKEPTALDRAAVGACRSISVRLQEIISLEEGARCQPADLASETCDSTAVRRSYIAALRFQRPSC